MDDYCKVRCHEKCWDRYDYEEIIAGCIEFCDELFREETDEESD